MVNSTVNSKMKVAVLCAMLPKDLQEKVSDKCAVIRDKAKEQEAALIFIRVKEEVKNVVKSRRYMIIPKPMDIDTIKKDHWTDEYAYDHDQNHDTEEDDSVCFVGRDNKGKGKGACFSCGMFGHRAAECPNKGAGEGDKSKRERVATTRNDHQGLFWLWPHKPLLQILSVQNSQHVREIEADKGPEVLSSGTQRPSRARATVMNTSGRRSGPGAKRKCHASRLLALERGVCK